VQGPTPARFPLGRREDTAGAMELERSIMEEI